jgi:predicted Zn-dependent protease
MYQGRAEEMLECFMKVLDLDPGNPGGHYHHAVALLAVGKTREARVALAVATKLGWKPEPGFIKALERNKEGQIHSAALPQP